MNKICVAFLFLTLSISLCAQEEIDSLSVVRSVDVLGKYKLFQTTNTWTFLKLDTSNGRIWQVQWSFNDDERFEVPLSLISLVDKEEEEINGRFTLYPTSNHFNFVLLDQINGKVYQVQWSQERLKRMVVPISYY